LPSLSLKTAGVKSASNEVVDALAREKRVLRRARCSRDS
jgi:hypothetical protein